MQLILDTLCCVYVYVVCAHNATMQAWYVVEWRMVG